MNDQSETRPSICAPNIRGSKRKRTSHACDQCRSRKHKCDGGQPACLSCLSSGQPCCYSLNSKRRGLPTGYVRSLELLWALVFSVVPDSEKTVTELLEHFDFSFDDDGKMVLVSHLANDSEHLRKRWTSSYVQKELDRRLSRLETGEEFGPSTQSEILENSRVRRSPVLPFQCLPTGSFERSLSSFRLPPENRPATAHSQLEDRRSGPNGLSSTKDELFHFPPDSLALLDAYFSFTHCVFPVVEKEPIYKVLFAPPRVISAWSGDLALIWAILSLSSRQRTNIQSDSAQEAEGSNFSHTQMYNNSRQLIPNEEDNVDLGHAQALFLLALYKLDQGMMAASWRLVGQAIRICFEMQPGRIDCFQSVYHRKDERLTRTIFGCFILDTFVSCELGKPPHIRTSDIWNFPLLDELGLDEWEPCSISHNGNGPLRAISIFNQLTSIVKILNRIMWEPRDDTEKKSCENYFSSMHRYCAELPPQCRLPTQWDTTDWVSPQTLNLHLAIRCTETILKNQISPEKIERFASPFSPSATSNQLWHRFNHLFDTAVASPLFAVYQNLGNNHNSPQIWRCEPQPVETNRLPEIPESSDTVPRISPNAQVASSSDQAGKNTYFEHLCLQPQERNHAIVVSQNEAEVGFLDTENAPGAWVQQAILDQGDCAGQGIFDDFEPLGGIEWCPFNDCKEREYIGYTLIIRKGTWSADWPKVGLDATQQNVVTESNQNSTSKYVPTHKTAQVVDQFT